MKICLITRECFPFTHGGIGTAFYSLGKMLANLNHEVILLTKKPANFNEGIYNQHYTNNFKTEWVEHTEGAFSVHSLLDYAWQLEKHFEHFNDSFQADMALYAEFDGEAYFCLREKNKGIKYRNTAFAVHFSGPLFALLEAEKQTPTLCEEVIFQLEAYSIQASSFAIAPSSFILERLKQKFNLQHQQHFIVPNPINNAIFTEPALPAPMADTGEKKILFIGRLQKTKGVDYLLDAFRQIIESAPDEPVRLQLIGRDVFWSDYNMPFQEYCKTSLPDHIYSKIDFIGHISQANMFAYHKQAWIAVFPSRFETFGNVALECLYSGTPVIVSKNTGLPDVTGSAYNYFWNEENGVEELTELLQKVLSNPKLRNELAQKSYKRAMELHTNLPGDFVNTLQKIITTGKDKIVESTDLGEQLFLLLNQYSAFWQQQKNAEIQAVYIQKDEELKKVWEQYDNKNNELADSWQKHEDRIKEIWAQYDEKDKQMSDVWRQHDEKDKQLGDLWKQYDEKEKQLGDLWRQHDEKEALLQELRERFNQLEQQFSQLQEQYNHSQNTLENLQLQLTTLSRDIEKQLLDTKTEKFSKLTIPTNPDLFTEIELLYYQINILKKKKRRFF